jgi:hypothetical protein
MTNGIDRVDRILRREADVPVMGISEFHNWYRHYGANTPELRFPVNEPERAVTDCIDAHLAVGMNNIVWSCGRSVVSYRSDLPRATLQSTPELKLVLDTLCPLRTALDYGKQHGVTILGRLAMNRHYGSGWNGVSSRFAQDHPEYMERSKLGRRVTHRLCYALDEVQDERIEILLEIQRIGVDALVLDFARQMPVLLYHDALVNPYRERTGEDPRALRSTDPADYAGWFQYRADVLTGFMRRFRERAVDQERRTGRPCPVIARVPDSAPWLMIAYGLDLERWYAEDLVDGVMLTPFPRTIEDTALYPEHHVELAHRYGKSAIGGLGSLNLMRSIGNGESMRNTGFFHPKPALAKVDRQLRAGADAVSIYQSETLARLEYLKPLIRDCGSKDTVDEKSRRLADPDADTLFQNSSSEWSIGLDWHAAWCHPRMRKAEALSAFVAGDGAL